MRIIIIVLCLLLTAVEAYAENLYLCNGGDGSVPTSTTCATAWDEGDFNTGGNWGAGAGKISAGDAVYLMDEGGDYDTTLTIQASGTSGNVITIGAYTGDTPVVSGEDTITGAWTEASGTYNITYTTEVEVVWQSGVTAPLEKGSDEVSLTAGQFYWTGNKLYVKLSTGSPDSGEISTNLRSYGITATDKEYITIEDITFDRQLHSGIHFNLTANKTNITIDNITATRQGHHGIYIDPESGVAVTNVTVSNSTVTNVAQRQYYTLQNDFSGISLLLGNTDTGTTVYGNFPNANVYGNVISTLLLGSLSSENHNGIQVNVPTNSNIYNNIVDYTGHGIVIRSNEDPCSVDVYNNIMTNQSDDSIWQFKCIGDPDDIWIYNNWLITPGDDCLDFDGTGTAVNNTCINPAKQNVNISHASASGIIKNNIFVRDNGNNEFIEIILAGAADWDIDNNIYYDSSGTYGDLFIAPDVNGGTVTDWATWLADSDTEDTNSKYGVNPMLGTSFPYCPAIISPTKFAGYDSGIEVSISTSTVGNIINLRPVPGDMDIGACRAERACGN